MSESPRTVGYIGLGIMGRGMAANLLKAGHRVLVWNRTPSKAQPLVEQGAIACDRPVDMAMQAPEVIFLNVTNTDDVWSVLFDGDGVKQGAKRGLIVVDHSTISPTRTQQIADLLREDGVTFLDAPVSGGDVGARNGTLSIMVGGDAGAVERVRPLLECMGQRITHVGPSGAGQACKACNQVAVVSALLGVCEAITLAKKTGLDVAKMIEVVSAGAGGSWQLANLGPRIAAGDFAPGFMVDLVLKDLGLVADAAAEHNISLPGVALVRELFQRVADSGGGKLGTQALVTAVDEQTRQ
jgi:3-hydroxyisobutyrate dehydrogenase